MYVKYQGVHSGGRNSTDWKYLGCRNFISLMYKIFALFYVSCNYRELLQFSNPSLARLYVFFYAKVCKKCGANCIEYEL